MSSPIARCPRCGHHSRFDGRAGSVVRCSCGADLVLSEGVDPNRSLFAYPEPAPRDSDGPVDEGGGEAKGGDNDHARRGGWADDCWGWVCPCGYRYPLGGLRCPVCCRYPVRDCEGAEDAPRDCLEG